MMARFKNGEMPVGSSWVVSHWVPSNDFRDGYMCRKGHGTWLEVHDCEEAATNTRVVKGG